MHDAPVISTIAVGLALACVLALIAHRLRLPPIAGYLVAGMVIGPFTPGFVADQEIAAQLAEVGVILLMFGVGLHFSLRDLMEVRRIAVPGAIGRIVAATGGGFDRSSRGPARTAVAAAIAGTLLVTAVATVHRATEQVTEKPELAGYPFDLEVGGFDPATWPTTVELLTQSDRIAALTLTEVGIVSVDGQVQQAAGFDVVRGTPLLTVVDGRLPVAADEIAVAGVSPLRVGSRHTLSAGSSTEVRVVGRVIIELGDGASSAEVLTRLDVLSSIEAEMLTRTALVGLDDPAASAEIDAEVDDVIHGRSDTPRRARTEKKTAGKRRRNQPWEAESSKRPAWYMALARTGRSKWA